ncbi:MAG: pyridine nucleotide-disulfide oxidoreductase [Pseudonocardiaceae bacterium]|nr:pyridine nucleotide-disulfide oxidoreductase [Pseudonocardiaceae bacterium]
MIDSCVVIGAGIAGVNAAEALREKGFEGTVTMIGAEHHQPYDRPPLSKKFLLDNGTPPDFPLRPQTFYDDCRIDLRLGAESTKLDVSSGAVVLDDGTHVHADKVVLATGGRPRRLGLPGCELVGVHSLRTVDDAAAIRGHLDRGSAVAVIGGGFIGTEVAAAAAAVGCPVTLIETERLPMQRALGTEVASLLSRAHRQRGVILRTGVGVDRLTGRGSVTGVELTDGSHIPAELVVVGVGMVPNVELAAAAGLVVSEGVRTDQYGRTSHPAIFAAGDVAEQAGIGRLEHWQQARDGGGRVAHAILGQPSPETPMPWFWSDQFDLNIQLAGTPSPSDSKCWRGDPDALKFSVLYHQGRHVTGIIAVNRGKDVRPAIELIKLGSVVDSDLLDDPATPVRAILKATRGSVAGST